MQADKSAEEIYVIADQVAIGRDKVCRSGVAEIESGGRAGEEVEVSPFGQNVGRGREDRETILERDIEGDCGVEGKRSIGEVPRGKLIRVEIDIVLGRDADVLRGDV